MRRHPPTAVVAPSSYRVAVTAAHPPLPITRRTLEPAECRRILASTGWGVLSVVEENRHPVAGTATYASDGETLWIAVNPGRQLAALEKNPHLCLTLVSVDQQDEWQSLELTGQVEWVDDNAGRMRAIRAFARQARPSGESGVKDAGRLLDARIARVTIDELAGRTRG